MKNYFFSRPLIVEKSFLSLLKSALNIYKDAVENGSRAGRQRCFRDFRCGAVTSSRRRLSIVNRRHNSGGPPKAKNERAVWQAFGKVETAVEN